MRVTWCEAPTAVTIYLLPFRDVGVPLAAARTRPRVGSLIACHFICTRGAGSPVVSRFAGGSGLLYHRTGRSRKVVSWSSHLAAFSQHIRRNEKDSGRPGCPPKGRVKEAEPEQNETTTCFTRKTPCFVVVRVLLSPLCGTVYHMPTTCA